MNISTRRRSGIAAAAILFCCLEATGTALAHPDSSAVGFQSPSGNIVCVARAGGVDCDIAERTYAAPPRPDTCHLNFGSRILLTPGAAPYFDCYGQSLRDRPLPTLDYDRSLRIGSVDCTSAASGVTCTDTDSGHNFTLSREFYQMK
jgi:hypothetical protein